MTCSSERQEPAAARELDLGAAFTLLVGDCREILPALSDASVDMIFMDPPYGHRNNDDDLIARREKALGVSTGDVECEAPRPILQDDPQAASKLVRFLFAQAARLLKPGGGVCCCCCCCCCCGGGGPDPQFARWSLWLDEVLDFKQMVVWDKGPMGMGWHYRRSYETVLVAQKRGAPCRWYDETARVENIIRPGDYGIRKIIPSASEHPAAKPPELAAHFIRLHTRPGELVLDPVCGAGSTLVAAKALKRRCLGIELDPRWAAQAKRRLAAVTQEMWP